MVNIPLWLGLGVVDALIGQLIIAAVSLSKHCPASLTAVKLARQFA